MCFHFTTRPHVWIQFHLYLPNFTSSLIRLPINYHFVFVVFISIWLLHLRSNFTLSQVGPNILFIYSLASIQFQFCFERISPCLTTLCSQILNLCNRFKFSHISSPPATTASHFLHYLLVDQLYAKEVYFCSFVTKCNQASTKYSPDVFKSFYRIVTHGEFHGIFTVPPPVKWSFSKFHYRTSSFCCLPIFFIKKLQVPSKRYTIFQYVLASLLTLYLSASNKIPFLEPHFSTTLEHPLKVHAVSIDPDVPPLLELGL